MLMKDILAARIAGVFVLLSMAAEFAADRLRPRRARRG